MLPPRSPQSRRAPRSALVVSQQKSLGALVALCLNHCRVKTVAATTIKQGLLPVKAGIPDLLVADVTHGRAAMALLGATGPSRAAAIALLREPASTLEAFQNGADQVAMVPFTPDELAVRTFALLRRLGHPARLDHDQEFGDLALSLDERIEVGGRSIPLTPVLNSLLYLLAANRNRAVALKDIRDLVWGFGPETSEDTVRRRIRELGVALGGSASIQARHQAYVLRSGVGRDVSS